MSNREYAHALLDRIPESRLAYIVYYLEGAAVPDEAETPNAETQEAFEELDNGGGHAYSGPVENLISSRWRTKVLEVKYSTRFKKDLKVCQKRHST